jgi:Caspase domain
MDRKRISRRKLLAGAGWACTAPWVSRAHAASNGVALVIGNSRYRWEAQLPNVQRDAPDVARAFQALGLQTEMVLDATRDGMRRAFDKFQASSAGANFSAFYFAGHGATWDRSQYLVPVDADLGDPSTVASLVKTTEIGPAIMGAAHRLQVFDNCRNNPADGWRQLAATRSAYVNPDAQRSLFERAPNSLVLFSTAPGHAALDGPSGQNSPFAAAFLRQMQAPSVDIQSISSKIRREVLLATEGRQVMFDRNGYDQPFLISGTGKGGSPVPLPPVEASRIVELPKAYSFAQENGLPLPSGLVALRTVTRGPDARMIGSWAFVNRTSLGKTPGVLVVMSVAGQAAEIILSVKGAIDPSTGKMGGGAVWRFLTGGVSGSRLEFVPRDQGAEFVFSWRDDNSGSIAMFNRDATVITAGSNIGNSEAFSRLDG